MQNVYTYSVNFTLSLEKELSFCSVLCLYKVITLLLHVAITNNVKMMLTMIEVTYVDFEILYEYDIFFPLAICVDVRCSCLSVSFCLLVLLKTELFLKLCMPRDIAANNSFRNNYSVSGK